VLTASNPLTRIRRPPTMGPLTTSRVSGLDLHNLFAQWADHSQGTPSGISVPTACRDYATRTCVLPPWDDALGASRALPGPAALPPKRGGPCLCHLAFPRGSPSSRVVRQQRIIPPQRPIVNALSYLPLSYYVVTCLSVAATTQWRQRHASSAELSDKVTSSA
jgi:hypothetical protein